MRIAPNKSGGRRNQLNISRAKRLVTGRYRIERNGPGPLLGPFPVSGPCPNRCRPHGLLPTWHRFRTYSGQSTGVRGVDCQRDGWILDMRPIARRQCGSQRQFGPFGVPAPASQPIRGRLPHPQRQSTRSRHRLRDRSADPQSHCVLPRKPIDLAWPVHPSGERQGVDRWPSRVRWPRTMAKSSIAALERTLTACLDAQSRNGIAATERRRPGLPTERARRLPQRPPGPP